MDDDRDVDLVDLLADEDNPMLAYLRERSREIASEDGLETALAWITRHAWFEGAISERARIARLVDED
jgi:hypothetical protein